MFTGIIPGLSRDRPGLLLRFPGNFVYVFPCFPDFKTTHKQIWPLTHSWDNPQKYFVFIVFLPKTQVG